MLKISFINKYINLKSKTKYTFSQFYLSICKIKITFEVNLKTLIMKTHFLLPNQFKKIGWMLFIPSIIVGTYLLFSDFNFDSHFQIKVFAFINDEILSDTKYFTFIENGILDEMLVVLIILGAILIGFSETENEDEFISKIRYESLVWATYLNFGLMLLSTLFIYGFPYFDVLIINIFAMLLFFIIRFHFMIYKLNKSISDDE